MYMKTALKKRTLLYLASGDYHPKYEKLPYDKVILVDDNKIYNNIKLPANSKVEFWVMDALDAIDEIKRSKLTIDCLVSVNEGLHEGGGTYVIFSEFLLGYISPYLADEILVITNLNYYEGARIKSHIAKMDWGFEKVSMIKAGDEDYINPAIFSQEHRATSTLQQSNYGHLFHLKRLNQNVTKKIGFIQVSITHDSIWKDQHKLDFIGLSLPTDKNETHHSLRPSVTHFFYNKPKTHCIIKLTMDQILDAAIQNGFTCVGLTPWTGGDYTEVFDALWHYRGKQPLDIRFYHVNQKDFFELYLYFSDYFLLKYPQFFEHIKADSNLIADLEEVLNKGGGRALWSFCETLAFMEKQKPFLFHFKQIKCKLGKLRIYANTQDSYIKGMIRMTEELAFFDKKS
jgi:hypothetical protein